jgi:hypothetical protein
MIGVGAAWKVAGVDVGSTVAIFGLGSVGLAVCYFVFLFLFFEIGKPTLNHLLKRKKDECLSYKCDENVQVNELCYFHKLWNLISFLLLCNNVFIISSFKKSDYDLTNNRLQKVVEFAEPQELSV